MKIIISPAKKMKHYDEWNLPTTWPLYADSTQELVNELQKYDFLSLKRLLKTNDDLTSEAFDNYQNFDLLKATPALFAYDGIQYSSMNLLSIEKDSLAFLEEHLVIVSGLYGLLRATDLIKPYRLEMQTKLKFRQYQNIYDFWDEHLSYINKPIRADEMIINLASKEYTKLLKQMFKKENFLNIFFYEKTLGGLKEKGVYAKIARGTMVRYIADEKITDINKLKDFNLLNYHFSSEYSDEHNYIFIREERNVKY